jgi:hypothetical protein
MDLQLGTLAKLPPEIRATIFEYTLTRHQLLTFRLDRFQREYYIPATQPALTRVSRQLRSESLPIFYESNDFVIHTESPQTLDARRWLEHNRTYLPLLRRISFWLRYVPFGAIQVTITRARKHDPWKVGDRWKWITVVREPPGLTDDVAYLLEKLRELVPLVSEEDAGPEDYFGMVSQLRKEYVRMKAS